jgi:hypothetical protein
VIDLSQYRLNQQERAAIKEMLERVGNELLLEQLWTLIDEAWVDCKCNNRKPNAEQMDVFYRHPVWLLNGMFVEQHDVSMGHRRAITQAVARLAPQRVVDFGGGFGTLARLLAAALPNAKIDICEPYPPSHGVESCGTLTNISFSNRLSNQTYDVLVSTDVLEHVEDPLGLLASMVSSVRLGGHLFIASCFYPIIACHLPATFHLRYSFDEFCVALGLEVVGPCIGSHATVYRRAQIVQSDWAILRKMERRSKRLFPWRRWRDCHEGPWSRRLRVAVTKPWHYPLRLLRAIGCGR